MRDGRVRGVEGEGGGGGGDGLALVFASSLSDKYLLRWIMLNGIDVCRFAGTRGGGTLSGSEGKHAGSEF